MSAREVSRDPIRLTEWTSCGGCAAKWGGDLLRQMLLAMPPEHDPENLLVGLARSDDAAVLRLSDDVALVSTTDFFPPLVDDPADFGAIAAANACSDVYAMGGQVRLALNVAAFPEDLPTAAIEAIFAAAAAVVVEAGGIVAGGHTIRSEEPIFGLAVQGVVHPDRVWRKSGGRPGDALVLSKPLGTGLVLAAGDDDDKSEVTRAMRELNRRAAQQLATIDAGAGPHACTDVTGYGLAAHGWEMAERGGVALRFHSDALPAYAGALEAAARGVRTGGDTRNRA
ncbi:MAG: selenide, water dikinase SelD, partial [Actinobacteria bacterium]|nr:selenide, water dikinase SelD [Actinomycetota bacterium]